ncbi:hypothetical protein CDV31_016844 [Fusarium ambrosium]|uniref:Uncharacterized protein n=1 Tax=Fusarium ambrosium TaxID=131363 RepID=A0A428S0E9_9HYPO|nr:hypothetical protein CDV31_016844 [Fusarium ambrosium]
MSQINTPQLKKLWEQVQSKPEWATTKFWEYVFKQNVFGSRHWAIASQQPPTDDENDLRRVDLVVENIDDNENSTALLLMEAKRANVTLDLIDEVEYQAFTACWQEILRNLNFIKHNPIPGPDIFQRPPSPRPASASLPPGWHDNEVAFIAPPMPSQVYEYPSSSRPAQQPPNDASGSQFQLESTYQGLIVDANDAFEATVDKYENNTYKCNRVFDKARIHVPDHAWVECAVQVSGELFPGYSWAANSGRQYYTWSLEPAQRPSKKRR